MNTVIPFNFENRTIRVLMRDGEPWFVAKDVCDALHFGNARQAVESHVDVDDVQQMDVVDEMAIIRRALQPFRSHNCASPTSSISSINSKK